MNTIGERIYEIRKKRNMSQGELADKLDVSRQTVSKWENNMCLPEVEKLLQLSEALGVTTDYILKGIAEKESTAEKETVYVYITEPCDEKEEKKRKSRRNAGIVLLTVGGLATVALVLIGLIIPAVLTGVVCLVGIILAFGEKHPILAAAWTVYIVAMCCLSPFMVISPIMVFVPHNYNWNDAMYLIIPYLEWSILPVLIMCTLKTKRGYVFKKKDNG
ncbi:MAG: helix-turn-helix transcriptional regulator [Clostridia bacterium]|nr:helix-turn-helix transcriptional regulator [Clostridia bacterium]